CPSLAPGLDAIVKEIEQAKSIPRTPTRHPCLKWRDELPMPKEDTQTRLRLLGNSLMDSVEVEGTMEVDVVGAAKETHETPKKSPASDQASVRSSMWSLQSPSPNAPNSSSPHLVESESDEGEVAAIKESHIDQEYWDEDMADNSIL
ncbi:hypothetical protein FRC06_003705, partial [Ceratobasidium sp. 370]